MVVGVGIPHKDICPLLKQFRLGTSLADIEMQAFAWVATREKTGEAVRVPVSRLYRVEWVDNEEGDESDSDESADAEMEVSADAGDANMDPAEWRSARAWAEAGEQWERMGDDEEESAGEEGEVDAGRETGDESSDDEATEDGAAGP